MMTGSLRSSPDTVDAVQDEVGEGPRRHAIFREQTGQLLAPEPDRRGEGMIDPRVLGP